MSVFGRAIATLWPGVGMKRLSGILAAAAFAACMAVAQDGAKQDMKDAGSDTKQAAKDTGHAAKHTGKAIKKGTKKAVHKSADKTEEGAAKVKEKTE